MRDEHQNCAALFSNHSIAEWLATDPIGLPSFFWKDTRNLMRQFSLLWQIQVDQPTYQRIMGKYEQVIVADYVVVGAGASGSVLAAKLAQKLRCDKIVVLEAGGSNDLSFVKDFRESLFTPPEELEKIDYGIRSVKQKHMNNRVTNLKRAKILGGCSSNNQCLWVRGSPDDYKVWTLIIIAYPIYFKKNTHSTGLRIGHSTRCWKISKTLRFVFCTPSIKEQKTQVLILVECRWKRAMWSQVAWI